MSEFPFEIWKVLSENWHAGQYEILSTMNDEDQNIISGALAYIKNREKTSVYEYWNDGAYGNPIFVDYEKKYHPNLSPIQVQKYLFWRRRKYHSKTKNDLIRWYVWAIIYGITTLADSYNSYKGIRQVCYPIEIKYSEEYDLPLVKKLYRKDTYDRRATLFCLLRKMFAPERHRLCDINLARMCLEYIPKEEGYTW